MCEYFLLFIATKTSNTIVYVPNNTLVGPEIVNNFVYSLRLNSWPSWPSRVGLGQTCKWAELTFTGSTKLPLAS